MSSMYHYDPLRGQAAQMCIQHCFTLAPGSGHDNAVRQDSACPIRQELVMLSTTILAFGSITAVCLFVCFESFQVCQRCPPNFSGALHLEWSEFEGECPGCNIGAIYSLLSFCGCQVDANIAVFRLQWLEPLTCYITKNSYSQHNVHTWL